ncbi:hypothetical protein K440DRAFT_612395 [Wilcoxina mikolae CBS 423.85]|nr:hypothetical protein K440DRAFT_612395 [Wilcoxina mikolae CBS 423.85]
MTSTTAATPPGHQASMPTITRCPSQMTAAATNPAITPHPPVSSSTPPKPSFLKRCYAFISDNVALTVAGIVVSVAVCLAWYAIVISLRSLALAEWTAMKDFRDHCESQLVRRSKTQV